jgi:hypothetical protein
LKRRGLTTVPQIAVAKPALAKAGGALGFWKALGEVWPTTREQRCWVHKTANILNKMPKSLHTKAKRSLQEIWMAETKKDAVKALEAPVQARGRLFVETYQVKYKRAFKLAEGAQKSWRRIDGHNQLPKLIQGVKFADAIEVIGNSAVPQAQAAA